MTTTGMLHEERRLIGRLVRGTASGRTGVLRAVAPDGDAPQPVAWLIPTGGGIARADAGAGDRAGYSAHHVGPTAPPGGLRAGR